MDTSASRRILIVANRTAATPGLIDAVRKRASEGPCQFALLVPRTFWDADTEESAITLELAIPLLEEAAGSHVEGLIGDNDPFAAVTAALEQDDYDEIIISTLPTRVSHWLHLDLPARVQRLGLPVTVVTARKSDRDLTPAGRP
jgi:hypothetical protein